MPCPPESPREASLRSKVIWSFWVVILLLGLPIWYYTTSIYRAALPTNLMLDFSHDQWYHEQRQNILQALPPDAAENIQKAANRAFKPSSEYHLTFSLFTAGSAPSSWDVRQSIDDYIQPILQAISSTTNVSATSQVHLYSSFSPSIHPQQSEVGWRLKREDLTSFINTAEWPLSPSIGNGPTINFIAYVPSQKHIPLLIEDSSLNSWLIPQWGGITIVNPPLEAVEGSELGMKRLPDHLDAQALVPAFENFQTQLLQLLGVPQSAHMPLQARLETFQKLSALSLYDRTSSNLHSLARLSQHLSSIPIPKHVLKHVENALHRLGEFKQCFASGDQSCFRGIREAFIGSERAFFDKAMVGQVYFPDEHKIAVYLPLLGPIGVPLVVGLIKELKSLRR